MDTLQVSKKTEFEISEKLFTDSYLPIQKLITYSYLDEKLIFNNFSKIYELSLSFGEILNES